MKLLMVAIISLMTLSSCKMTQKFKSDDKSEIESENYSSKTELSAEDVNGKSVKPGRYLGYLKLKNRDISLPFVIELVAYRYNKSYYKLRSVVKILHGGYQSHEYAAQYFQHVNYKLEDGSFEFKGKNKKFSIKNAKMHNDIIVGKLTLGDSDIEDGEFFVEWQAAGNTNLTKQAMLASYPVVPNLTGSYIGACNGIRKEIQLEVFRESKVDSSEIFDWKLSGRIGDADKKACEKKEMKCKNDEFTLVNYDFLNGNLKLVTKGEQQTCKIGVSDLDCGMCKYLRINRKNFALTNEGKYDFKSRDFHMAISNDENASVENDIEDREGIYYGYLHHEINDRYQLVRLNIKSKKIKNSKGVEWDYLYGTTSLFFGKNNFSEFVAYEYMPRRFVKSRPVFIFDGVGESFFAATHWTSKSVEGIWYSKNFGRVGTIEMVKGRIPFLSEKAEFVPPIGGQYDNNSGQFQIVARPSKSETYRDFFPLTVFGWAVDRRYGKKRSIVTSGNYDFYSSVVSLSLEDGRRVFGNLSDKNARFFWPTEKKRGLAMANHITRSYVSKDISQNSRVMNSLNGLVIEKSLGKNYFIPNRIKKGFKKLPGKLKIETNMDNYLDEDKQY